MAQEKEEELIVAEAVVPKQESMVKGDTYSE